MRAVKSYSEVTGILSIAEVAQFCRYARPKDGPQYCVHRTDMSARGPDYDARRVWRVASSSHSIAGRCTNDCSDENGQKQSHDHKSQRSGVTTLDSGRCRDNAK